MRRLAIAFALSTLLLIPICSAQQTATTPRLTAISTVNPAKTTKSDVGIDTVVNCATAANNYIAVFTAAAPPNIVICNSAIYQDSTGKVGIATTTPAVKLDVHGAINTSDTYRIGNSTVLSIGSSADHNLFVGVGAGANNEPGQGKANVFLGYNAGNSNSTGALNVFSGFRAGQDNTSGFNNIFLGPHCRQL